MRYFYIDYENKKNEGLNGIAKLSDSDTVKIFYSEDAQTMTFGTHRRIIESNANFEYAKLSSGMRGIKNALDILIMHDIDLKLMDDKQKNNEYFIVSDDKDFDSYIQDKTKKKIKISRISEVCNANVCVEEKKNISSGQQKKVEQNQGNKAKTSAAKAKAEELKKKENVFRSFFGKNLKEFEDDKEYIVEAYMNARSKQEFNNMLQQHFYNEDVSYIRETMKEFVKGLPGR